MQRRSCVFVLDDDCSIRASIERLLRGHGFGTRLFGSVDALRDYGDLDDALCLVIDIDLGGQSGIDLRRQLAKEGVTAPVIYITGNDCPINRSAAIASGCIAYLTKPFAAHSLIESIESACANTM